MPSPSPILYTMPADVVDLMSSEGVELALDDHNDATGQKIQATATAVTGDTSLSVAALAQPLLKGTVLRFDGGGMAGVVTVTLSALALVGATTLAADALEGDVYATAAAQDSGLNLATNARLVKGCRYGTTKVKLYCCGRYDDSQLAVNAGVNGSVNLWATAVAARWVATRLSRGCPKSLQEGYDDALDEMRQVQSGKLSIENVGTRTSGWPFLSNVTVDSVQYQVTKSRVEPQISEGTPTVYPQYVDWQSIMLLEW